MSGGSRFGSLNEPPALEAGSGADQQVGPRLARLAVAVLEGDQLLGSVGPWPSSDWSYNKIKAYGWTSRWYQAPDFPPRSAGAAGPTGRNPDLVNTFWDAVLS